MQFCALLLAIGLSTFGYAQNLLPIDVDQRYLVLSTTKISTMEKELPVAAALGFRVLYAAPTPDLDLTLLLERLPKGGEPYTYKILATSKFNTMENELNEHALQGYRLLPRTIIFKQGLFTQEVLMIMERSSTSDRNYEYRLVSGNKETKIHKNLNLAIADGFLPVTMVTKGDQVIVTERLKK